MSVEFGRAVEITKKTARRASGPAIFAMALLSSGCSAVTDSTKFPPCSEDPQIKLRTIKLSEGGLFNSATRDHYANVDGVTFKLVADSPPRVDIKGDENRVNLMKLGHVQFSGESDGRIYDVTFPVEIEIRSDQIMINVVAACK